MIKIINFPLKFKNYHGKFKPTWAIFEKSFLQVLDFHKIFKRLKISNKLRQNVLTCWKFSWKICRTVGKITIFLNNLRKH